MREADPPAGEGWPKKRTPAAERHEEGREVWLVLHRPPVELAGYERMLDPKGC